MLFSFFKDNTEIKLIRVIMDNNAVVAYINNTRGIKSDLCDNIGFHAWQWVAELQTCISGAHIPGSEKVIADKCSRMFEQSSE